MTATATQPVAQPQAQAASGGLLKADPRALQIKGVLESESMQRSLAAALPRHLSAGKLIRCVLGAFQRTPKLLECTPESILYAIMQSAAYGLEPDGGPLGHGYLVPFWNGKTKRTECQFIPGYRGLVKLARNSGEVADVWAEVVFEADRRAPGEFSYELGLHPKLTHKRNDAATERGELLYAYAVARFRDGERKFVVLNRAEVEAIKAKSSSKNRDGEVVGPWIEHTGEMWKKTAVRRLAKMLPLSVDDERRISAEDDELPAAGLSINVPLPAIADAVGRGEPADSDAAHAPAPDDADQSEPAPRHDPLTLALHRLGECREVRAVESIRNECCGPESPLGESERRTIDAACNERAEKIRGGRGPRSGQQQLMETTAGATEAGF